MAKSVNAQGTAQLLTRIAADLSEPRQILQAIQTYKQQLRPELDTPYSPPRTPIETTIATIWADILHVNRVGVHDDFFRLGGHSLSAVQMLARLIDEFQVTLPLQALLEAPTIATLAELVTRQTADGTSAANSRESTEFSPLVPLQPQGGKPPMFFVHAVDGGVFYYRELARLLGSDQPLYAIQSPGLESDRPIPATVEDMAITYIDALHRQFPGGPYLLGGYSFGGLVAYEMACRLEAAGTPATHLALIDTTPRPTEFDPIQAFLEFVETIHAYFHVDLLPAYCAMQNIDMSAGDDLLRRHLQQQSSRQQLEGLQACIRHAGIQVPGISPEHVDRIFDVDMNNLAAGQAYIQHIPYYEGQTRITLFRSADDFVGLLDDADFGWGRYTSQSITMYDVPGTHFTIVRPPNISVLADHLKTVMRVR